MKTKSDTAQRQAARKFVEYWTFQRGSEKGEDQQFWNSLLRDVLGVADVEQCIKYQVPVPMAARGDARPPNHQTTQLPNHQTKYLDAWIPETRVLIEHKSRGVNLDAPQAGHGGLTPYDQAAEYDAARPFDEKARWIVTCNFDEFRIYDRAKPLAPPLTLKLGNLPKEAYRLAFLVNPKEKAIDRELEISVQAGRIVGEIYDALLGQMESVKCKMENEGEPCGGTSTLHFTLSTLHSLHLAALNRLCVRLVFCLYAEDADIFPKDCFRRLIENTPAPFLRERLKKLFEILDTPLNKRDVYLEPELCAFPYTNGGLFKCCQCENVANNQSQYSIGTGNIGTGNISTFSHSPDDIPPITDDLRQLLIGASQFDWRDITPTIFGALFESTLNPVTRRSGGMVYTSVENIHKVIDPLFLDDLTRRVEAAITKGDKRTLLALQAEMASRTFLDPACGSGNFLTETYICLRRLENRIIAALQKGQAELDLGISIKVSITQFYGLEINDFAVAVAKAALWIAESQMKQETAEILHREPNYLPLKDNANIVECNALRTDWPRTDYIIGNPPFSGARWMGKEQKADVLDVFGKDWQSVGDLDYVCCWYKKAMDLMRRVEDAPPYRGDGRARPLDAPHCAFVSTNSICQGGAVANLWKPLFAQGLEIDFAHRTFRWDNEAFDKAHVHCVIIGFHVKDNVANVKMLPKPNSNNQLGIGNIGTGNTSTLATFGKTIFDGDRAIPATHINGYLRDAPDAWLENITQPLYAVPSIGMGNQPIDGGNYLFTAEDKAEFLKKEALSEKYFRQWYGAEELINGKWRYCLWLGDCTPTELFAMPECLKRVDAVRAFRLSSKRASTRKLADKPTRFQTENFPKSHYIVIPEVSSEKRRYIPMGYLSPDVMCSNKLRIMPDATPFHFGVLMSSVHKAWVDTVCGRLKSDLDYSINIVYNNFPWPECLAAENAEDGNEALQSLRQKIALTGQAILDARAKYPDATLAQMYGDKMYLFPELVAAHEANDRAVLAAYGLAPDTPEPEIVAHLFKLYTDKVEEKK